MKPVVVLPVSRPDAHLASKWLAWVSLMGDASEPIDIVVMGSKALNVQDWALIKSACAVPATFRDTPEMFENGYAPSANYMFRSALELVERDYPGRPMLWCEADSVPMRPSWVREITDEYVQSGKPFMGDFVIHPVGTNGAIDHMTGNGMYSAKWREIAPSLALLPGPNPHQGWDSQCAHDILPQAHHSRTIQQIWRPPTITDKWARENIRPECALFHQDKHGNLIDVLCDRMGEPRIPPRGAVAESTYASFSPVVRMDRPKVEILIVTHARDEEFLRYCLRSVQKFATGFSEVRLVVPRHEISHFSWAVNYARVSAFDQDKEKPFLSHQIQKCRADEWCPCADIILHLDADCMFMAPVTPDDYIRDGRCMMLGESYERITNQHRHRWAKCVELATGWKPLADYMTRHPFAHPRSTYAATRKAIESHTGTSFNQYVLERRNEFPQGFAEFPTLATVGLMTNPSAYFVQEYDFKADDAALCGKEPGEFQYLYRRGHDKLVEMWSHGGVEKYRAQCEAILAGKVEEFYVK